MTGIVRNQAYLEHFSSIPHPERPERLTAILELLEKDSWTKKTKRIEPFPAAEEWLKEVHTPGHIELVRRTAAEGGGMLDPDTYVSPRSFEVAKLAAGGVLSAIDAVIAGTVPNALALVRPPGHHATREKAMGFCLFNNVAIGTRYVQKRYGLKKILIIDFDVHHGNGTQEIFYYDPDVLYFSIHQFPHYPGTGSLEETGDGPGEGATINVPLPPGSGDEEYVRAMQDRLWPATQEFRPEFVLVSAGFDAHESDPLSSHMVTEEGFRQMTEIALRIAGTTAGGKLVSSLEGGYDLAALARSVEAHLAALCG